MTSNYNVIDLFSGCGGFSKGFEQAGYNILMGIDNWKDAITTYKNNHENAKTINDDITGITGQQILDYLDITFEDVDVIIGGPPCQGFSLSGKRTLSDPRNILYKSFVDIVNYIRPKAFVMENVPGLVSLFKGEAKNNILNDFQNIGYNVNYKILNASNFGVPQNRKRVFFVGIKEGTFKFPNDFLTFQMLHMAPILFIPILQVKKLSMTCLY
ncbi:DNA cytosine methyltransferase [Staphylococcus nepalensis]|nr:DNA cytosine methyltransferase [Staphylococcus nepalensis]